MSLQWRDEIVVSLAPRRVQLRRMGRGLRPICLAETAHTIDGGGFDWRPALTTLQSLLTEAAWSRVNVRVIVSNAWSRYAIIPWSNELTTEDERLAHARICLSEVYGATGPEWVVCLSDSHTGRTRVACALPEPLLTELRARLQDCGVRLLSAEPALTAAYNRCREQLPDDAGWFVNIEEGALAAVRLVPDGWDRVYTARIGRDWDTELARLRVFAKATLDGSNDWKVYVDAPSEGSRMTSLPA